MTKRNVRPDDLLKFHFTNDPQISPDGARILFQKKHVNDKNKYIDNLYVSDVATGAVTQWTQGEGGAGHGRWSRDGNRIAFISGREGKQSQLFVIPMSGGEARKLTSLPEGTISGFKWSPDGTRIAFTFRELAPEWTEKAGKEREEKGLSTPPRVTDSAWYRLDGDGYFGMQRFAVYVVDVATGKHSLVYNRCEVGNYSLDWSPDSKDLAILHTTNKNIWGAKVDDQIWRVSLQGGAIQAVEGLPKGRKMSVAWSPDGKMFGYLGDASDESDVFGVRNVKLYVAPVSGGSARCLTEKDDYCLATMGLSDTKDAYGYGILEWSPNSQALYVSVGHHGSTQLARVGIEQARVELLTQGKHSVTPTNLSGDGRRMACTYGTATRLNEVAVLELSGSGGMVEPRVLTSFNDDLLNEATPIEPEEFWVTSPDGARVHAWVMKPPGFEARNKYAAVLEIHGGPHAQYGWAYFHQFQVLAAAGYVVVYSNPRGSKGYGEKHVEAIRGAWGDRDWVDIQSITRWMKEQPYIDSARMGVTGGSYGGYMTNWVVGHCHDFRAAITDRCVSSIHSLAMTSDLVLSPHVYWKGCAWSGHEQIAEMWKQSPIAYFDQVETPMLIIHSEGDLRCNVSEADQIFSALQVRGIESRLVRYPASTSHGMSRSGPPDLRLHRLDENLKWWKKYLG